MKRGIYVSPTAVTAHPDYARRLRGESGIGVFLLRAGFDPRAEAADLEPAADTARRLGAEVWVLLGTWWGHGTAAADDRMVAAFGPDLALSSPAHESQWAMSTPGGPVDGHISAAIDRLCGRLAPEAICLTHARYRHAADIAGLFETGPGPFAERMAAAGLHADGVAAAWRNALDALQRLTPAKLLEATRTCTVPQLLDALAGSTAFTSWFRLRAAVIEASLRSFRRVVPAGILFGQNAYVPSSAVLVGQDYGAMGGLCDFVQPLLGYVEWHVRQPVAAWARLLLAKVRGLAEPQAVRAAASLLGLGGAALPGRVDSLIEPGEGRASDIESVVRGLLPVARRSQAGGLAVMPVLRGSGWPAGLATRMASEVEAAGFEGVFFQGTQELAGTPPGEGWG